MVAMADRPARGGTAVGNARADVVRWIRQGAAAAALGKPASSCPYKAGAQRTAWLYGHKVGGSKS